MGQRLGLWHHDITGEACSISIYKGAAEVKPAPLSPENILFQGIFIAYILYDVLEVVTETNVDSKRLWHPTGILHLHVAWEQRSGWEASHTIWFFSFFVGIVCRTLV